MRIGFDVDHPLFDFTDGFHLYSEQITREHLPSPTTWEFWQEWGWSRSAFDQAHEVFVDDHCYELGNLVGGDATRDAMQRLRDAGHTIVLITARYTNQRQQASIEWQTRYWLAANDVPYDELHFNSDKGCVPTDWFIDDRPENLDALPDTTTAVLMNAPWNTKSPWFRVHSVADYVDLILESEQTPVTKPEETRITSITGGQKGSKQARFDLLPSEALWEIAELYGRGAAKYEDRNWERGYDFSLSYAALQRHANQFWQGIDADEETGLSHMASVAFHALALMTFVKTHPEFDNRPGRQDAA